MNSVVLALDTSTEVTAVGIGLRDGDRLDVLATCDSEAPRAAMSRLLPCVHDLLGGLNLLMLDVDEVVVGRGPGSFTGVRIGVSTAKGIAHGLGAPLYGVGTLDVVAWHVAQDLGTVGEESRMLGVLGDAMRGEVYPALFEVRRGYVERLTQDRVAKPAIVAGEWASVEEPMLLAGNALHKYAGLFDEAMGERGRQVPPGLWAPSGKGLLEAYTDAWRHGQLGDGRPGSLLPVYTRLSDAEEAERVRRAPDHAAGDAVVPGSVPESGVDGPLSDGGAS